MEMETQTVSSEQGSSPTTPDTTSAAPAAQTPAPDASAAGTTSANTAAPAWTPDFKFKVMDKEYEIDPLFRPVIKDEETLKKVRRLQEQALGIPHLEASRDEYKNKYTQVAPRLQEYDTVEKRLDKLSYFVQNKNYGAFFDDLQIPKADILAWVKSELEAEQLPPHVREAVEQNRILQMKQWEAQQELAQYKQQAQAQEFAAVHQSIDAAISSVGGDVAGQFNERMQDQTAFRNAVINKGVMIQQTTGQKLPPSEVVALVKADLARVMGIVEGQGAQSSTPQQATPAQKPPVIPVVKAGGQSPVKRPPRSIEELKKLASAM